MDGLCYKKILKIMFFDWLVGFDLTHNNKKNTAN